jgi:hypothetical protein
MENGFIGQILSILPGMTNSTHIKKVDKWSWRMLVKTVA